MTDTINLGQMTLRCKKCGGQQFIHPVNPNLNSHVTCQGCGAISTVTDLLDPETPLDPKALQEAERLAAEALRAAPGKQG